MKFLVTLFLFFFINTQAFSDEQYKIRFVHMDYIFKNSSIGKKISKNIIDKRKSIIKRSKEAEEKLTKQKNDILSKKNVLEKTEFEQKVASHQKEVEEYQIKKNKELANINKTNVEMTTNFLKKVDQILLDYANENKIDLVLKKETLIVSNSTLDITKDILKVVDSKIKKIN
jgi:Skp family chaperone for outer membrane proteins